MPVIQDKEFGKITIKRSSSAVQIRIKVAPDGTLRASLPMHAPIVLVKYLIKHSRGELRDLIAKSKPEYKFENGSKIGKSHVLIINEDVNDNFSVTTKGLQIIVNLPPDKSILDDDVVRKIRDTVISALRIEAKSYLPKRLTYLAEKFGFNYNKVRFSHASGRWGSYSSNGTVSLNIALMKLPFELIDYIIIHELTHSKQMNHSAKFWSVVESADPDYKSHRQLLKTFNPSI